MNLQRKQQEYIDRQRFLEGMEGPGGLRKVRKDRVDGLRNLMASKERIRGT